MKKTVRSVPGLLGQAELPPDKSIAHRSALLAALGNGRSQIVNYPDSADPQSTLSCLRQLGVTIEESDELLFVEGVGLHGLRAPDTELDCGNSGTTMRLLAGILAGQSFDSVLTGDASLSVRPMGRIADPLNEMGARVTLTEGHAPVMIKGGQSLKGITYPLPMPSAQVKSCVLLAGLYAQGETTVIETLPSRDHTERMLRLDAIEMDGKRHLTIQKDYQIPAGTWAVPKDFSAAAFFLVGGSITPYSKVRMPGVGINSSRSALINVLRAMGARITIEYERVHAGEPIADLVVESAPLKGVTVQGSIIPSLIDEIPILAVAAACASGTTIIKDAEELRVKETDRLAAMETNLKALGVSVEATHDSLVIEGGSLKGATVQSFDDHRIAMAMGIAGLVAEGETVIEEAQCVDVSFPGFWDVLEGLCP